MHPAGASDFEWDEHNEAHLAEHGIMPFEVVQIFFNRPQWLPNKRHGADRWKMIGFTDGGRALSIIVQVKDSGATVRPFTGWDCTAGERTRYLH